MTGAQGQGGLTLIELLLALLIAAIVSGAGISMTRQTLAAHADAEDLIADVQALGVARALIETDLASLASGKLELSQAGTGMSIGFRRVADEVPGGDAEPAFDVAYTHSDGALFRAGRGDSRLLLTATDVHARFLGPAGWTEQWPEQDTVPPRAIALVLTGTRWGLMTMMFPVALAVGPR